MQIFIDVETAAGAKLGQGPIITASGVSFSNEMDRAGQFGFTIPATDAQADLLSAKRKVRFWGVLSGALTELGDGVIDTVAYRADGEGHWWIDCSGFSGLIDLAGYTAWQLTLSNGTTGVPEPPSYGIDLLRTYAVIYSGALWTFNTYGVEPSVELYGQFQDESILRALGVLCERAGAHFRYDGSRNLTVFYEWEPSGVRAIQARGELPADACAIVGTIKKTVESGRIMTRILPRGAGNGQARLDLKACTRTAPVGYTLNKPNGFISNAAAVTAYGDISKFVEFKDIKPLSNTDADLAAAANALYDAALIELDRSLASGIYYQVQLAGCQTLLKPGQTIRIDYHNTAAGIAINDDLYILKVTTQPTDRGMVTTSITVATVDQWLQSDTAAVTASMLQARTYQAHAQLNANAYVTSYKELLDDTVIAAFSFEFGDDVAQINQVLFTFDLLPFESTIKSVGGTSTSTTSGGGGTSSTAADHTHGVTLGAHTHTVAITAHTHTVTVAAHSHTVTVSNHTHTVSISAHTHTVTVTDHTHTVSISSHTHTVSISSHDHGVTLQGTSGDPTGTRPFARVVYFDTTDDNFYVDGGGVDQATTTDSGGSSSPTTASGGSSSPTSSSGGGQTPTSSSGGSSTPTSGSGGGQSPSSTDQGGATPTTSSGGGSTETTAGGGGSLETAVSAGSHTHTVAAHTHDVTAAISAVYGIFREIAGNTYVITDLEYRVNGGSWANLSGATALSGSRYRLDLTALVSSTTTFRPLAEDNLLEIRKKAAAAASKTVAIRARLSVRNIIQAINYV
jgi:hypothetical protein